MNFGLFGAGRVGQVHASNIAHHPGAQLTAVHDLNTEAATKITQTFGGTVAHSPDEIWDNRNIDAVLIASPTDTHVELLLDAIKAGKPAYCEKPIDIDLERAKRVATANQNAAVPIFVGFRRRFIKELQAVHKQIQNGAIGAVEIIHMIARDAQPPPIGYIEASGGFIRDKAIHYFDLLCWLTGETPTDVHAMGSCVVDQSIGDAGDVDTVIVTLKMPNGALCQITNGRASAFGVHEKIEVYGADGLLQWDPSQNKTITLQDKSAIATVRSEPGEIYFNQHSFAAALDSFIESIKSNEPCSPSLHDGLVAQSIADAATTVLNSGRAVRINA